MATARNMDRDMRRLATLEAVARPFLQSHMRRLVPDADEKTEKRAGFSVDDQREQAS